MKTYFLKRMCLLGMAFSAGLQAGQIDTRTYTLLDTGMSESEVISRAGPPDMVTDEGFVGTLGGGLLAIRKLHYVPGPEEQDPYLTVITIVGGRVSNLERTIMTHRPHRFPAPLPQPPPPEPEPVEKAPSALQEYQEIRERLLHKADESPTASKKVYKWMDEKGDVHFDDRAPQAPSKE